MSLVGFTRRARRPAATLALALVVTSAVLTWTRPGVPDERFAPLHLGGAALAALLLVVLVALRRLEHPRNAAWLFAFAALSAIAALGSGVSQGTETVLGWVGAGLAMALSAVAATAAADVAEQRPVSRL